MRVLDPGHRYELAKLDEKCTVGSVKGDLVFVKRIGDKFPGNVGPPHAGATTQEVIRALIDRTKYTNEQEPCTYNLSAISHLRYALSLLEECAAVKRDDFEAAREIFHLEEPELEPTCPICGHLKCDRRRHA